MPDEMKCRNCIWSSPDASICWRGSDLPIENPDVVPEGCVSFEPVGPYPRCSE